MTFEDAIKLCVGINRSRKYHRTQNLGYAETLKNDTIFMILKLRDSNVSNNKLLEIGKQVKSKADIHG